MQETGSKMLLLQFEHLRKGSKAKSQKKTVMSLKRKHHKETIRFTFCVRFNFISRFFFDKRIRSKSDNMQTL
jgi:hypothetical protein